jgi:hypothetical protein
MIRKKVTDDIGLARDAIQTAYWSVGYHEKELEKAHHKLGLFTALLKRAGLEFDPKRALAAYDNDQEGEDADLWASEGYALNLLGQALSGVAYHEEELADAHRMVAMAKALIMRAGLESEIPFAAEEERAKKRLAKK